MRVDAHIAPASLRVATKKEQIVVAYMSDPRDSLQCANQSIRLNTEPAAEFTCQLIVFRSGRGRQH